MALALGHASATTKDDEVLAALHAVDDAQLLAEVARRNLVAPQDQRALEEKKGELTEVFYSYKYQCECDPTASPTPKPATAWKSIFGRLHPTHRVISTQAHARAPGGGL